MRLEKLPEDLLGIRGPFCWFPGEWKRRELTSIFHFSLSSQTLYRVYKRCFNGLGTYGYGSEQ